MAFLMGASTGSLAQGSFAPQAGQSGSTAIPADSSCFRDWAISCSVERGPQAITDPSGPLASGGALTYAVGQADAPLVISLGDGGTATLQFSAPIYDGEGADFAVFENGFLQGDAAFLELAFVEVSSNGIDFIRFPAQSETDTTSQIGTFDVLDASEVHNLAGKYIGPFGTPFDLAELPDTNLLDKSNVTHVRIIDVVGSIDPTYASRDAMGRIINDPWPTDFESGGFDLDAVGVIHSTIPLGLTERRLGEPSEQQAQTYDILGRPINHSNPGQVIISGNQKLRSGT